ncbi:uncharacterized protein [Anabrus simplex]|uniref:uncharacterized protein n=1 Tax=Anabrus simplex TaxID=316456 RepID=UPI0035A32347
MVTPSLFALVAIFFSGSSAHAVCVGQEATAIALVALHEGPNCTLVSLRGIQQQAAILAAAKEADSTLSKDGMNFRVRVFDTCSDPREAVSATLRSLAALPHACLQPPLLLGFVGPEDGASLEGVQKVTRVFNLNHAVPFRLDSANQASNSKQGPLYVTSLNQEEQLQSVLQLVAKLHWKRVTLLYTADTRTSQLASALARRLCVTKAPLQLPEYDANASTMNVLSGEEESPVVIVAGSSLPVSQFLRQSEHSAPAYLVVAGTTGLLPELTYLPVAAPVVVLQYTAGRNHLDSALWEQHVMSTTGDVKSLFADVQDPTVTPMAHAVRLYGSALTVVRQARCQGRPGACSMLSVISPDQWRNLLSVAMTPDNSSDPASKRIRFRMEIPSKAEIFLKMSVAEKITQVGRLDAGKLDLTSEEISLLASVTADVNSSEVVCWNGVVTARAPATKTVSEQNNNNNNNNANDDVVLDTVSTSDEDLEFYEMIAYLSGISAGIFLLFIVGLFIVIRSFIPKKPRCSPPSSVSSVRTRD